MDFHSGTTTEINFVVFVLFRSFVYETTSGVRSTPPSKATCSESRKGVRLINE